MHTEFLAADVPLVKTFTLKNGDLEKSPYPMVRDFTSHRLPTTSLDELHVALLHAASQGWCMQKGLLTRPIKKESRAGLTNAADATHILMLDFDGLTGYASLNDALKPMGLDKFDRIVQWSASAHLPQSTSSPPGLSAHIFFWLSNPVSPQLLKSWLMNTCMTHFASCVTLTKSGAALHWPVDPSVMDNSKLIYIAPPVLRGLSSSIQGLGIEIVHVSKKGPCNPPSSFFTVNPQIVQKARHELLNTLRKASGYTAIRDSQLRISNGQLYLSKPGQAALTGLRTERGFVYINLNGGDSWGYYHPEDNPEYIYNFKGEPIYKTEELLPEYWASLKRIDPQRPQSKVQYFVGRDFATARYYNGIFHSEKNLLEMARATTEGQLKSFMKQHGQPVPDFIPDFTIEYNPHNPIKFSLEDRYINTYEPSRFEHLKPQKVTEIPPTIKRIITSAVGGALTLDHFINWTAEMIQYKTKTGTAWVWQGIEGTGKGFLFHNILKQLLGPTNAVAITTRELDSSFNGYLEHALLVFVDEVQLPALKGALGLAANLRSFITEPEVAIRRMYCEAYTAKNFSNFILASNMPDPVVISSTDRRFHVGQFQATKLVLSPQDVEAIEKELTDFWHYLKSYQVNREAVREILESEDRARLMDLSMSTADSVAASILAGDMEDLVNKVPLKPITPAESAYAALVKFLLTTGETHLHRDELRTIFQYQVGDMATGVSTFAKYLAHHQIHTKVIWRDNHAVRGFVVNWQQNETWRKAALAELTSTSEKRHLSLVDVKKARLPSTKPGVI